MKPKIITHPASMQFLVDTTWEFAHGILWSNCPFSTEEIERCKSHLRNYYKKIPAEKFMDEASAYFLSCCCRILLLKEFILKHQPIN